MDPRNLRNLYKFSWLKGTNFKGVFTTEAQRTQRTIILPLARESAKGKPLIATRTDKPPAAVGSFIKSAPPDFMKIKFLCFLCVSVVKMFFKRLKYYKNSIPLVTGLLLLFGSGPAGAYTTEECLGCHGKGGSSSRLMVFEEFRNSAHGKNLSCRDCHTGIKDESHKTRPGTGIVQCGRCHDQDNRHGFQAQGRTRPQCHECHTRHHILAKGDRSSSVHPDNLPATCKGCHPRQCGKGDYLSWFPSLRVKAHKKQDFSRSYSEKNCLGCHQGKAAHGEYGLIDNQTCYKCHQPLDGKSPQLGSIHPQADLRQQPALVVAAVADQVGIGLVGLAVLGFLTRRVIRSTRRRK
jgi:hypothetical protein